jgi:hypothetical protein
MVWLVQAARDQEVVASGTFLMLVAAVLLAMVVPTAAVAAAVAGLGLLLMAIPGSPRLRQPLQQRSLAVSAALVEQVQRPTPMG